MAKNNREELIREKEEEINGLINHLSRQDYRASKLVAELCAIVKDQLGAEMSVYDGYVAAMEEAQTWRGRINELEEEIEELKK